MTDQVSTFSDEAITILDSMPVDPSATHFYEHLSGGLVWSDEFPDISTLEWDIVSHDDVYRHLIYMRGLITLGRTEIRDLPLWQQVVIDAPNWPGLLPERRTDRIRKRLRAAHRLAERCYNKMEEEDWPN